MKKTQYLLNLQLITGLLTIIICAFLYGYLTLKEEGTLAITANSLITQKDHFVDLAVSPSSREDSIESVNWSAPFGRFEIYKENKTRFYPEGNTGPVKISAEGRKKSGESFRVEINIDVFSQLVLLKADDLAFNKNFAMEGVFDKFYRRIQYHKIKASVGLMGQSLVLAGINNSALGKVQTAFFLYKIKKLHDDGIIEIWHHGYDHGYPHGFKSMGIEFEGKAFDYQLEHLQLTQKLSKRRLGISLKAFGAPCNAIDALTDSALEELDEINVKFFTEFEGTSKLRVAVNTTLEAGADPLLFKTFSESYRPDIAISVIQIHPKGWNDVKWRAFDKSIKFLKAQKVKFVTPQDVYKIYSNTRKLPDLPI